MKKKLLFVFVLLSILIIGGCSDSDKKQGTLTAPQEIIVQSDGNKSLIIFDEVENAQYYNIYINDMAVTVKSSGSGTIYFDASKIITLPQKYTIKVKAGSSKYFESAFSQDYEYNHTSILQAPVIHIDGTVLNWDKVPNADFYDVMVTTHNPTVETVHRFPTNTFNFASILANKGEYTFKVSAVSEGDEYLPSIYSNQVKYTNIQTLTTPHNLQTSYDLTTGEKLLSFISSENVSSFVINIDGINYNVSQAELNNYLVADDYDNLYVIKLSSFIESKQIQISNSRVFNISIKAVANGQYLQSSNFSNTITCDFVNVLSTPRVALTTTATTCIINISATNSQYLSSFAIYLNNVKYKTVLKNITQVELPLSEVGACGIRVKAISNNNNCHSSLLSEVQYVNNNLLSLTTPTINYNENILTWATVTNATSYYVEISNKVFTYAVSTTGLSLDLSTILILEPSAYNIKVIAMAEGFKQSEGKLNINYATKLTTAQDVATKLVADNTYLYFEEVEGAYGYVIYLNDVMNPYVFTSSPINISAYISSANSYTIRVQAISPNTTMQNSDLSTGIDLQTIKILTAPKLTVSKDAELGKYYLNVDINEAETTLVKGYEIWINYVSIGVQKFTENAQIDVTSYFANAGQYNFMIKALSYDENEYVKDSIISSITEICYKQLEIVTGITVQEHPETSTYILNFNEQTLAAKYLVTITRAEDNHTIEFELNGGNADITEYVKDSGIYKISVKAIALDGGFYTDSPESGNPYRLVKGWTLPLVNNIAIKSGTTTISWNKVETSTEYQPSYQVKVYYVNFAGESVLKLSLETQDTSIEIGRGTYKCLNTEGTYNIQVKALGDGNLYESSQISTYSYDYVMSTELDFRRNTVFMYGQTCDYVIDNIDDLKYLLWYHYLYNDYEWTYNNSLDYKFKIYCTVDASVLSTWALSCNTETYNLVESASTMADKLYYIADFLLKQYPEIAAYSKPFVNDNGVQKQQMCKEANEQYIYLFRYEDVLDNNKLDVVTPKTSDQVFNDKIDLVDTFDKRLTSYVFNIDTFDSVDVTTTEQLFMAVQYGKRPNFVGDSAVAEAVYENARFILREICSDAMTEYQKTLQIYDFLIKTIAYNNNVTLGLAGEMVTVKNGTTYRGNIKDFYLEGILYNSNASDGLFASISDTIGQTAVCDGLAKAFVLLCSIEGIDCIKVEGTTLAGGHSWNKVYIDVDGSGTKQWYAVDITNSRTVTQFPMGVQGAPYYQIGLHTYFLVTDSVLKQAFNSTILEIHQKYGEATDKGGYVANYTFNYYNNKRYSYSYRVVENGSIVTKTINTNLQAYESGDIDNIILCSAVRALNEQRVIIDFDASVYITANAGSVNLNNIVNTGKAVLTANGYSGQLNAIMVGNVITIIFEPLNYRG